MGSSISSRIILSFFAEGRVLDAKLSLFVNQCT